MLYGVKYRHEGKKVPTTEKSAPTAENNCLF